MFPPVRTAAPTVPLLSLDEVKRHCRVETADDDALLADMIEAATARLDGYAGILGRALVNQSWRLDLAGFCDPIRLPLAPIVSVTHVKYYDAVTDTLTTLATSVYELLADDLGGYVALKPGQTWPAVSSLRTVTVQVTYVAGYGAAASAVPAPIRAAAKLMVGDLYAARETFQVGSSPATLPTSVTVDRLLAPYRRVGF